MPGWQCDLQNHLIRVRFRGKDYGAYQLLREPYCRICSYPDVAAEDCRWHHDDYDFERIYAMGKYLTPESEEGWNDLLSKHIRGLKMYVRYSEPLGIALSLCMKHVYRELLDFDVLVPVPLHKDELAERGFNQALELVKVVSSEVGIPYTDALGKQASLKQKDLKTRVLRKTEVKGLYRCLDPEALLGKRVILVDDVSCSGSNASECSDVMIKAGSTVVNVLVAGRDVLPPS